MFKNILLIVIQSLTFYFCPVIGVIHILFGAFYLCHKQSLVSILCGMYFWSLLYVLFIDNDIWPYWLCSAFLSFIVCDEFKQAESSIDSRPQEEPGQKHEQHFHGDIVIDKAVFVKDSDKLK